MSEVCEKCFGTGLDIENDRYCPYCEGQGEISKASHNNDVRSGYEDWKLILIWEIIE